ncbi:elongation factor P lysine(34) lysyltransferase [Gilliamella sp. wkB292]|uniref:elongation factor P--(R)-beta-lysine ligase n=1 Tax=unclassified Gilliamella TaxID=2685620 RepID=UPI00080EA961|nr:elongation factor P--(R)-beta-lysine ligase [Gilliamella apicola]OCG16147.1 elongation factor P lysine(34) lysyltransferase [Gilliamella apicola]OCL19482.1 elongation factor P lysine(34) lysyltransferase [Gilliamella apicola]
MTWQPSSSINNLLKRAKIISQVRQFFADRCILEVETPTLSQYAVTDVHLSSFTTTFFKPGEFDEQLGRKMSLITSPEYHMKRLLAAGSGPIFQICKCFRNHEEVGRFHNPEFTMLEWYRIQYDMMQMINEVDDLLQTILDCEPAERVSYQKAFQRHLNIDPLEADHATLVKAINQLDIGINVDDYDKDGLLQCLFTFGVEPHIGLEKPIAVYHFPASQAALAAISSEDHRVAGRFEFYYKGVELANGFKELTNSQEQRQRFEQNNLERSKQNLPEQNIDIELLAAMESGLPDCAGVAIGLDRLIMLALNSVTLDDVISFTFDRA